MTFGLIGPLEIRCYGQPINVPAPRQRSLLAALLLRANQPVPKHSLCEAVWADRRVSDQAETTLRSYVMRLRRVLGPAIADRLCLRPPGYLLRIDQDEELDLLQLQGCVRRGKAAAKREDWDQSLHEFLAAIALWRGEPLCDVPSDSLQLSITPALTELRTQAWEGLCAAASHCGRTADFVIPLEQLTEEEPLSERFSALLMATLASCNRRVDALAEFRRLRHALVQEQGMEPSNVLRELHQQLLHDNLPAVALVSERRPGRSLGAPEVPRQLPRAVRAFAGRAAEVASLASYLSAGANGEIPSPVAVVSGIAGIGKSDLVIQAAHQVAEAFPDGQFYAELHGSQPNPLEPGQLLAQFLRAVGVDRQAVAAEPTERLAQYRSALADRRMLIVLDDAADAEQVRPLIPGSGSCGTLVTSRRPLADLAQARLTILPTLDPVQAVELFRTLAGPDRLAGDDGSVSFIVAACAGLPLALRIAAARLAARPSWPVGHLASLLADERQRLDQLCYGSACVRASLDASYRALTGPADDAPAPAARAFAHLGRWPRNHITVAQAANLFRQPAFQASHALETLIDAGLLESPEPGIYLINELTRLFAAECPIEDDAS